jgi:hypothetical protein
MASPHERSLLAHSVEVKNPKMELTMLQRRQGIGRQSQTGPVAPTACRPAAWHPIGAREAVIAAIDAVDAPRPRSLERAVARLTASVRGGIPTASVACASSTTREPNASTAVPALPAVP